jgi:hypothetical protein
MMYTACTIPGIYPSGGSRIAKMANLAHALEEEWKFYSRILDQPSGPYRWQASSHSVRGVAEPCGSWLASDEALKITAWR